MNNICLNNQNQIELPGPNDLIINIDLPAFAESCLRDGLRPLRMAGAELIARGLTTVKEVVAILPTID